MRKEAAGWLFTRTLIFVVAMAAVTACRSVDAPPAESLQFISIEEAAELPNIERAGFDIDDTLLFSTPAFDVGQASSHAYDSEPFWTLVNGSDRGNSRVKLSTRQIVERYQARGIPIYAITARSGFGGDGLKSFISDELGIPANHVFFEPDGKADRIRSLRLDVYFGDSDSDIEDAMDAEAKPVRIQRSPKSSYRNKDGSLRKYQPGRYGEAVVADSEN